MQVALPGCELESLWLHEFHPLGQPRVFAENVTAGVNPLAIRRGLERGTKKVVTALKEMSKQITAREEMAQVVFASAKNVVS